MSKIHIIPDTDFTTWGIGNPVPSDRCVEGRIISTQLTTIQIGVLKILLLHHAEVSIFDNMHLQLVGTWLQLPGHVDAGTDKGTVDSTYLLTIQQYICLPVDTIEVKIGMLFLVGRRLMVDGGTIPEIRIEERLRNLSHIVIIAVIRHRPDVHIAGKYGTRHGSLNPGIASLAAQLPLVKHLPAILGSQRIGCLGMQTALTHHLHLRQGESAGSIRFYQLQSHISAMTLASHFLYQSLLLLLSQGSNIAPVLGIIRNLNLSVASLVHPEEIHLVEVCLCTQIHIEPLCLGTQLIGQARFPYT